MEKKKLNHYDVAEVIDRFEINKVFKCNELDSWVEGDITTLKPAYVELLEDVRQQLEMKWDEWNESQRRTVRA